MNKSTKAYGEVQASHVGNHHVVGGGGDILILLAVEDLNTNKVNLCVAVLAGLRGAHVHDLASMSTRSPIVAHSNNKNDPKNKGYLPCRADP